MKKLSVILIVFVACMTGKAQYDDGSTLGQPVRPPVDRPWKTENIGEFSDPVGYVPQLESDVMYYVTIWRTIDLREKINHPLYFPTEPIGVLRSLGRVIFDALDLAHLENENALPLYEYPACTYPKSRSEILSGMSQEKTITLVDDWGNPIGQETQINQFDPKDILSYRLKEVWFFDSKRSLLDVRILYISPMIEKEPDLNLGDNVDDAFREEAVAGKKQLMRLGFIFYDELRPYLAKQEVFNIKNNAQRISFDDLLTWKRQFASYVTGEENVYDNREIKDYMINPRDQILKSEDIKDGIRRFEHDLWQF